MIRKMPREAFATEIAPKAGWMVIADFFPNHESGLDFDTYLGGEWINDKGQTITLDSVTIGWNANHCASYVAIGDKRITGSLALIEARKHIESHSYAAV